MQRLITMFACTILTGCASYVDIVGSYYDRRDPCQNAVNNPDWTMPSFCGGSTTTIVTRQVSPNKYVSKVIK